MAHMMAWDRSREWVRNVRGLEKGSPIWEEALLLSTGKCKGWLGGDTYSNGGEWMGLGGEGSYRLQGEKMKVMCQIDRGDHVLYAS